MKTTALILFTLLFMAFSCKKPTVSGVIDCDPGWHPNADSTNCLIDSTSHNFIWTIDTLGIYGSYLNDVAIVDANNIWVVGNIETDSGSYNAAHWDGEEWELILIDRVVDFDGVFAFSSNEIWFSDGCFIYYYDGSEFIRKWECDWQTYGPGQANAIWGTSSDNLYFIGRSGSIVHYDGANFMQMDSGTDVDLKNISGTPDGEYVFAVGRDNNTPAPSVALEYTNGSWNTLYYTEGAQPHDGNLGWIYGVDVFNDTVYFTATNSLWKYNYLTEQSVLVPDSTGHFGEGAFKKIIIHSINDVFFAGAGFKYIHFNGADYHYSHEITDMYAQRAMHGADYNGELAVMVGFCCSYGHAIVAKGFRL